MSNWISVKDKLPELDQDVVDKEVLVCDIDKCIYTCIYGKVYTKTRGESGVEIQETFYTNMSECDDITHWMPLPEPPND
jgi:hypothetical protein